MADKEDVETGDITKGFNNDVFTRLTISGDGITLDEKNFTDGRSAIGSAVLRAYEEAKKHAGHPKDEHQLFAKTIGEVSQLDYREVQELMTDQVEQFKMKQLNDRYVALPAADPRKKAWFNTMKELGSFLRVSPTGDDQRNGLLNSEVQTMFALWLGLDIPVLRGCAGQKIGSQQLILDAAGLKLMSANLPGDHWRKKHDACKLFLFKLMQRADMECDCEVYDEFSRFMSTETEEGQVQTLQQRFNERDRRVNQGCVPDLKGDKDMPRAGVNKWLGEVKTLNAGGIYEHVPDNKRCAAVEKRAQRIHASYVKKINSLDEEFNKIKEIKAQPAVEEVKDDEGNITTHARAAIPYRPASIARRCAAHLETFGVICSFVVGAYGEWSKDVDALIKLCIEEISNNEWASSGFLCQDDCRSVLTAQIRQEWAFLCLQESAQLILRRLNAVGNNRNRSKKRVTYEIKRFERMHAKRVDFLSYLNQNPNNFCHNHFHVHCDWN